MGLIINPDVGLLWQGNAEIYDNGDNLFCKEAPIMLRLTSDGGNKTVYLPAPYGGELYPNNGDISEKNFCDNIILTDGEKVLPIVYNPKVSSLKTTILETKLDTISGGYPFFVRNGNTAYKEIPLQGLLSSDTDYLHCFGTSKKSQGTRAATPAPASSSWDDSDIAIERRYKLEVEAWLRNGEWKLLNSPTEGVYIVRLMNVSLTPVEQLGRRLHTFSATAYEVAPVNDESFEKMGFFEGGINS